MAKYPIARVADLPAGERRIVVLAGRSIGVFNVSGHYFALRNRCPHQGAALCRGELLSPVTSDGPGDFQQAGDVPVITCPWHGWEFDLASGQSWFDPATRVRSYDVGVERGQDLGGTERRPGPYRLETFPVSVEEDYVVVDLSGAASPTAPAE